MISAILSVALIGLTIGVAVFSERKVTSAIAKTAVSTIKETDYRRPTWYQMMSLASPIIVVLLLCILAFFPTQHVLISILLVGAFSAQRLAMTKLIIGAAEMTHKSRLYIALSNPCFRSVKYVFHFSAPDLKTPEHLSIWQDEIDALGEPWFVIFREHHHLAAYKATDKRPAILFHNDALLKNCLPASVCCVFYANNGQRNRQMIAGNRTVKHIQLLHGDSDKPPSYSPLTKNYDLVFVAGQMGIDRYETHGIDIPEHKFRIVGRPQVKSIEPVREIEAGRRLQVVYMPTWRGFFADTQFSSLARAADVVEKILSWDKECELTIKFHPLSYKDPEWSEFEVAIRSALNQTYPNGNTGVLVGDDASPFDLYNQADLMITDISSVMIDFLYSGKPFAVVQPANFSDLDIAQYPSLAASYQVDEDLGNLVGALDTAVTRDPRKSDREKMQRYAFGDYGQPPGEAFKSACLAVLAEHRNDTDAAIAKGASDG